MMKENMPGNGHRQTDGYVDRGPRLTNSFDRAYEPGLFSADIRLGQGGLMRGTHRVEAVELPPPYGLPSSARRRYTDELAAFFDALLTTLSERDQQHIHSIMRGESTRDSAQALNISQPAVVTARQRAIKRLVALVDPIELRTLREERVS